MKDGTKKIAIGAAIAGLAGYLTGILTAPKSGKETRQDIANKATQLKQEAERKLKALHSELDELLVQAKAVAKTLQKNAGEEFAEVVAKAQFAKEKARELLSSLHEGEASDKDLQQAVSEIKSAADHLKSFLKKHPAQ